MNTLLYGHTHMKLNLINSASIGVNTRFLGAQNGLLHLSLHGILSTNTLFTIEYLQLTCARSLYVLLCDLAAFLKADMLHFSL